VVFSAQTRPDIRSRAVQYSLHRLCMYGLALVRA